MPQVKTVRAGYSMKRDDPDESFHFVATQFFMYLRFETYLNTFKHSKIASNQLDTLKKTSKASPTCKNFNFDTLDEAFQIQSFGLPETS